MNGHYAGAADYISKEHEAVEILDYLHKNKIEKLALLQGTSMGAEVALEVARIADIPIEHYFFDGGPFFDFPWWFKLIMRKKFQGFVKTCRGKNGEEAFEALMKNSFVKWLIGKNTESYKAMILDFANVCNDVSDTTIHNVVETCYACKLPTFGADTQRKFVFFFSEREPARKSEKRLKKSYKFAEFRSVPNLGHGGLQASRPQEYAEYLKGISSICSREPR